MKASRKKTVIIIVSVLLVIVLAAGGILLAVKNSGKPVKVAPVSAMNNGYWNNSTDISPYGNVSTNLNQEIRYDESLIITEVYVQEGDTVKVGDPLIAYDTTLLSLELEMKEMEIEGIGLNIQNVQAELDQLRKTRPVAYQSSNPLKGMALATAGESPSEPESSSASPSEPSEPESSEPAGEPLKGNVYAEITPESIPYKGSGTAKDPYRFYVFPAEGKEAVTISREYLKKALAEKSVSVFDTVNNASAPTEIISSWEMDFNTLTELLEKSQPGTAFPEDLRGKEIYNKITEDSIPYNQDTADGSKEKPYHFLCAPGASADITFLTMALESQSVYVFEVVDNAENPARILYSWTLNGTSVDQDEPDNPDNPGFEDPGIDIPGIDIPSGPTKAELAEQIKEKEDALKSLDLEKRTAQLELKQLKKQFEDNGVITSTVNGTIKAVLDEDTAKLEGSPLITVVGEEGFYITGAVAETALDMIESGMSITATSWNDGMTYDATITGVSNTPVTGGYYSDNPNMSYYPFTAVIQGDAELKNGDGVDLSVDGMDSPSYNDVIYLDQAFVREENNRYYVYKKDGNDRLTKQYVEAGKVLYGSIEIKSGLNMDDEIAFPYGRDVKEGAKTESTDTLYNYGY